MSQERYLRGLLRRLVNSMLFGGRPSHDLIAEATQALSGQEPAPNQRKIGSRVLVDLDARVVYLDDEPVSLGAYEYSTLAYLLEHPRRALSRDQILLNVYGHGYHSVESTGRVDQLVQRMRRKLQLYDNLIACPGYGYRLDP